MNIVIGGESLKKIIRHSQESYPAESCGILLGRMEGGVKKVYMVCPTTNILNSADSYQINPEEQLEIYMKADELSLEVLGYYHSHPEWPAQPSNIDRDKANQPGCSYIIYSNLTGEARSYFWDGRDFKPEELIVMED
ncbi:MAG: M67 family metallopeptidase [Candidatus Bathyarchaeia archaeon]